MLTIATHVKNCNLVEIFYCWQAYAAHDDGKCQSVKLFDVCHLCLALLHVLEILQLQVNCRQVLFNAGALFGLYYALRGPQDVWPQFQKLADRLSQGGDDEY